MIGAGVTLNIDQNSKTPDKKTTSFIFAGDVNLSVSVYKVNAQ